MKKTILLLTFVAGALFAAEQGRNQLKSYFETGDNPSQAEFGHLIDSAYNKTDDSVLSAGTFAALDAVISDKSLTNLEDDQTFTGDLTLTGVFAVNGATTFAASPIFTNGVTIAGSKTLLTDIITESTGGLGTTFTDTTTFSDDATFSADIVLNGGAQLGNGSTDYHGINTAPQANVMLSALYADNVVGDSVGFDLNVDHSTAAAASASPEKVGYMVDQDITTSETNSLIFRTTVGLKVDQDDTGTYNTASGVVANFGVVADVNGTPTVTTVGSINYTGILAQCGGDLGTTGVTAHYGAHVLSLGTADTNYGINITASGATNNYAIWANNGDIVLDEDSQKIYFGESQDAYLEFDGTNTNFSTGGTLVFDDGDAMQVDTIDEASNGVGVTIEGVLIKDGSISAGVELSYGIMSVQAGAAAEATTDATPRLITAWNTNGISSGLTVDHTDDTIQAVTAGTYHVSSTISFSGSISDEYQLEIYVYDDSGASWSASGFAVDRKLGTGGDVGSCSIQGLVALDVDDKVGIYHSSSTGGTAFTATEAQLILERIAD